MHAQHAHSELEMEIQNFAATLNQCFRGAGWDVVNYYAANAWNASDDRAGARWPEVEYRVRTAWRTGVATRSPKGHRVLSGDLCAPLTARASLGHQQNADELLVFV